MFNSEHIFFVTTPFDMRVGLNRLTSHVQMHYPEHWHEGALFIFSNRQRTMLKLITIDTHVILLWQRKLHGRNFPKIKTDQVELILTPEQLSWLYKGVNFQDTEGVNLKDYVVY
ncbi:IS66 family insertion sequence element accessory protein TnpB [Thorsellia kenyensis]|uniref:IS66 family insertion sequence element accessory protein TnpB n=1 Tax=Thorsellia kenyensis TaxID=1549888 RepID=A0ABV6CC98_9GAMM